jgi:hypothetical protein
MIILTNITGTKMMTENEIEIMYKYFKERETMNALEQVAEYLKKYNVKDKEEIKHFTSLLHKYWDGQISIDDVEIRHQKKYNRTGLEMSYFIAPFIMLYEDDYYEDIY